MWKPHPYVLVFGVEAFGRKSGLDEVMRVWPGDGISALVKHQGALSLCEDTSGRWWSASRKEPSPEQPCLHLDLRLQPPELGEIISVVFCGSSQSWHNSHNAVCLMSSQLALLVVNMMLHVVVQATQEPQVYRIKIEVNESSSDFSGTHTCTKTPTAALPLKTELFPSFSTIFAIIIQVEKGT